jgi:hypothetical protein
MHSASSIIILIFVLLLLFQFANILKLFFFPYFVKFYTQQYHFMIIAQI